MLVLRCTKKLLDRLGAPISEAAETGSTTRLGEWYANTLNVDRLRLVLCVNAQSRLSVLLHAKELRANPGNLASAAEPVLLGIGVDPAVVRDECDRMREVVIAPTASRSVLGSMNDFTYMAEVNLRTEPTIELQGLALKLARVPCGPLDYASPSDVAMKLLQPEA